MANYLDSRRIEGLSTETNPSPTYETDFSSNTGWIQTGSNITINTGTNSLTWIGDRTTSSHGLHYDLGSGVVSSKWLLEFDFVLDSYAAGSATYTHQIGVMLTDVNSTSGTYGSDATRKFVGMRLNWRTDTQSQQRKFYVIDDEGGTETWADNVPYNTPDDSTAQSFPSAQTTYHMKLIKDGSSHSLEIWNSSQTSLLDTLNGSNSTTADIRYILVQSYNSSVGEDPDFDGKIQNMKFYNGVTSVTTNYKPAPALSLSGCKAYYNFEQTSGSLTNIATTANGFDDGLGSSADGTSSGGVTQNATGKVGSYAWDFDGSDDYVNVSGITLPAYNSTDTFSISAWINMDTLATSPTQYQRLFHWYDGTKQWQLYIFSSGEIGFNNTQANQGVDTSSSVISTGTWYHLVVVKTGNNTYKIYLNGVDQSTTSSGGGNPSPSIQTFRIGASITGSGSDGHFNGRIDEFSVFTRALTSSEVSTLYNSGTGVAVNDSSITAKPETNSIFIETDSARRYWFDGSNWQGNLQLNNYGYEDTQSTSSSRSLTFTVGAGSNRLLLVFVSGGGASLGVTSVTYGSQSLTKIADGTSGSPYYHDMELWGLVNPNVGTYSVTATQSGNTNMAIHDIISFYGAKQSLPTVYGTNSGNSASISHNITPTATGSWVIGALYGGSLVSSSYFSTAELQVLVSTRSFNLTGLKTNPTIGSANTIQWTLSGAQPYTSIAVAVEPIT